MKKNKEGDWIYPTSARELEKSWVVKYEDINLFFPKSIIISIEEYKLITLKNKINTLWIDRYRFRMPKWY